MTLIERIDRGIVTTLRGVAAVAAGAAAAACLAASIGMLVVTASGDLAALCVVLVFVSLGLVGYALELFPAWAGAILIEVVCALLALIWLLGGPSSPWRL